MPQVSQGADMKNNSMTSVVSTWLSKAVRLNTGQRFMEKMILKNILEAKPTTCTPPSP